jgi:pimeloyl-ACP methyl ester carboxylesterase
MLLALLATACREVARPVVQHPPDMDPESFQTLRPPVLGYQLLRESAGDRYGLIRADSPAELLRVGTLEECEAELVVLLEAEYGTGEVNLPMRTFGGLQLWADRYWFAGWRIQESVLTGHCRLLDAAHTRRAWGTYEACRAVFEAERVRLGLRQRSEHLVVLLHGLFRAHGSLDRLARRLGDEGYAVANLDYPSTRRSIAEHAEGLTEVLDSLEGIARVSFVTHSLGALVAREALAGDPPWRERIEVGRLVMIAPPSQGSSFAGALRDFLPFEWLAGPAGQEVVEEEARAIPRPDVPFGIIAGGRGDGEGWNPWLEGDDDGIVSVEETRLSGAADFLLVDGVHTFLMNDAEVVEAVVRFLEVGRFEAAR